MAHIPRVYHPAPLAPGPFLIKGEAAKRLTTVMRVSEREPILLFSGDGKEWHATAGARGKDSLQFDILELVRQDAPPAVVLETWVGVIRWSRFEDALEKLTETGADIVRPVICEFSQRGEATTPSRMDRWRRIVIEASEQSGRLYLPEVLPPAALVKALDAFRGSLVVASTDGRSAAEVAPLLPAAGHVALLVGPEGGLSPGEEQTLARRGAVGLGLGPNVLRTETAAVVGTAVLRALTAQA